MSEVLGGVGGVLSSILNNLVEFGRRLVEFIIRVVEKIIDFISQDPLKATLLIANIVVLFGG